MIRATWPLPTGIALASLVGLVAALTGDGVADVLAWAGLGVPVAAATWAWRARTT